MTKTVLVGLSGGVDSAVCAMLLKKQGYNVIGATMTIWGNHQNEKMEIVSGQKSSCYSATENEDKKSVKKLADEIGIKHYIFDCSDKFEKDVLDYFKKEYLKGRTPNPCVICNTLIKFQALPEMARLNGIDFDYFATGHYARIEKQNDRFILKKGIMPKKDQSYFLYRLNQAQLSKTMFPLGNYTKDEIRQLAKDFSLEVAQKPDSQDFYSGDYNDLLNVENKIGNIVDTTGKILGVHNGIWNYTIGQRKGLGISASEPLYVISLDKEKNEVVVGFKDKTFKKSLIAKNINLVSIDKIEKEFKAMAKIRSTQEPVSVLVKKIDDNSIEVIFDDYQKSIAIGQSVVIYQDDIVLLGGIIDEVG